MALISGRSALFDGEAMTAGLILTGGGARGAYQAGVLKAIAEQFPDFHYPFPVICGSSAGALNAVGLSAGGEIFRHSVEHLERLWLQLSSDTVYHANYWAMAKSVGQFVRGFMSGAGIDVPGSLLDNTPLREFLLKEVDFNRLSENIEQRDIRAVSVTACGYRSGQSVSFFQGEPDIPAWRSGQRIGVPTRLGIDHLMASSAIPTLFPPVRINREYFGDGVVRNMAPLSPAVHLGADRILVVGVSANKTVRNARKSTFTVPKLPHILEHLINGMFIDIVEHDVDRVSLINTILTHADVPQNVADEFGLRYIETLVISPSKPIDEIAIHHVKALPAPVRQFFGLNKEPIEGGVSLASYLLFESEFMRDLIALGYQDAKRQAKEIALFFDHEDQSKKIA